jgi:hypothetical protein
MVQLVSVRPDCLVAVLGEIRKRSSGLLALRLASFSRNPWRSV